MIFRILLEISANKKAELKIIINISENVEKRKTSNTICGNVN